MSDELKKDELKTAEQSSSDGKKKENKTGDEASKAADKKKTSKKNNDKNFFVEQYGIYKAEFKKIVWPSRQDLVKQTITVIVISLLFGAYISLADGIFAQLIQQLVRFLG